MKTKKPSCAHPPFSLAGFVFGMILLAVAPSASGFKKPELPELPNFDRREPAGPDVAAAAREQAAARIKAAVPGVKIERDGLLGTPKIISSPRGFLSGPDGAGGGVAKAAADAMPANDPHRAVKAFLNDHAALVGHDAAALATARVARDFTTAHNGLRTVIWVQELEGISVFESVLVGHITRRGELVNLSSRLLPDVAAAARAGTPNRARLQRNPGITAAQAAATAANLIGENSAPGDFTPVEVQPEGAALRRGFNAPMLGEPARVRLVWLPMNRDRMRLCWEIVLTGRARGERYRVLIDAETGAALLRHCLTHYLSDASYRVFISDSPAPLSPGLAVPQTNQPALAARVLVVTNALNTNASPNGWINDGDNETRGNNVDAHLDLDANNLPDLPRPQGSPFRVFDFPLDLTQPPSSNRNAAVVQLFYWCNWAHDKLYELGFTEAAGNFQDDNFGRGGLDSDAVQADAQDGSAFNNANFSAGTDGSSARMQMYLFNGPTPDRDASLDAEIILHEYVHGLSNRRVGSGSGLSALQSVGMGEGWSDFYALALLSEAGDDLHGNYALGAYTTKDFFGEAENYYYGIRHYPYSTVLAKNPLTFKDIDPTQIDFHVGIPKNPVLSVSATEVHSQGEVWCAMLWEARANLITRHGFTNGNQLILQLVTDGMALAPDNPTFVEARDAILQADQVLTGGTNRNELWAAFAKRGLGYLASAPPSFTTTGVVEDYNLPDYFEISPAVNFVFNGLAGGPFIPAAKSYLLTNSGSAPFNWTALTDASLALSSTGGTLNPGGSVTVTVSPSLAAASLPTGIYPVGVTFSNAASGLSRTRPVTIRVAQPDYFTEVFTGADFDLAFTTMTFTPDGSTNFYSVCREPAAVLPTDPAGGTAVSLGDDNYLLQPLTGGAQVSIYGQQSGSFYIGANAHLTLTAGHTSFFYPEQDVYFERARVSALYTDMDPSAGGSVSWKQLSNRVAVTYLNVPEFGVASQNSFQMELFFNGIIRITWLHIDAVNAVVGLSAGAGVPPAFVESDLSIYPGCTVQSPLLKLMRIGGNLKLTWPPAVTTFRLEAAAHLLAPIPWMNVTNTVQFTNGFNTVTLPATNGPGFFRLVTP